MPAFPPGHPDGPPLEPERNKFRPPAKPTLSDRILDALGAVFVIMFAIMAISGMIWCIDWLWDSILS